MNKVLKLFYCFKFPIIFGEICPIKMIHYYICIIVNIIIILNYLFINIDELNSIKLSNSDQVYLITSANQYELFKIYSNIKE